MTASHKAPRRWHSFSPQQRWNKTSWWQAVTQDTAPPSHPSPSLHFRSLLSGWGLEGALCVCVCVCAQVFMRYPFSVMGLNRSPPQSTIWVGLALPAPKPRSGGVEKYILQPFIKKIKRPHLLSFSISLPVFWGVWKASTLCKSEIPLLWKCTSSLPLFFKAAIIINNKPLISTEKSCIKCMCKNKSPPSSFFPLSTRLLSEDFQQ